MKLLRFFGTFEDPDALEKDFAVTYFDLDGHSAS